MPPKSWKTTVAGVCTILWAVGGAGVALAHGQHVDLNAVIAQISIGVGLIVAADHSNLSK